MNEKDVAAISHESKTRARGLRNRECNIFGYYGFDLKLLNMELGQVSSNLTAAKIG